MTSEPLLFAKKLEYPNSTSSFIGIVFSSASIWRVKQGCVKFGLQKQVEYNIFQFAWQEKNYSICNASAIGGPLICHAGSILLQSSTVLDLNKILPNDIVYTDN
jgi:hypothetical protein